MDRRDFLASSTLATIGLGLVPGGAAGSSVAERLGRDQFLGLVNGTFTAVDPAGVVRRLTLSAVRPGPAAAGLDQFSLVFDAADGRGPCAGLCWMRHAEMGWFELRLDTAADSAGCAAFSLLT